MRLPTLEEFEAVDSETVTAIMGEVGASGTSTAELIQKALASPPLEEMKVEAELMALLVKATEIRQPRQFESLSVLPSRRDDNARDLDGPARRL